MSSGSKKHRGLLASGTAFLPITFSFRTLMSFILLGIPASYKSKGFCGLVGNRYLTHNSPRSYRHFLIRHRKFSPRCDIVLQPLSILPSIMTDVFGQLPVTLTFYWKGLLLWHFSHARDGRTDGRTYVLSYTANPWLLHNNYCYTVLIFLNLTCVLIK